MTETSGKGRHSVGPGPILAPVETIAVGEIAVDDERFRITLGSPSDELMNSLARWGCSAPPLGVRVGGRLIPVTGFKRLRGWLASFGPETPIEVRVLPEGTDPLDVLAHAAHDVGRDEALTPFQRCRAMRRALQAGCRPDRVPSELLPALGLEPHEAVLRRHLKLERIPVDLARYLETEGVSTRRALRFAAITTDQASLLIRLANDLHLSLRALEECARMLSEVARRDGLTWREVAERAGFLADVETERPADGRGKAALKALWRLRYPVWEEATRNAARAASAVGVPDGVDLSWDERFEQEGLTVTVRARTLEELRTQLEALLETSRLERLAALFEAL